MAFRPDSRGVIVDIKTPPRFGAGQVTPYTRSIPTLHHLDNLLGGGKPKLCITRKQGGIGDVLMTLPTVKAIAKKYDVQVDYGTDFTYLDGALTKVLFDNPYIANVVPWDTIDPFDYHAVLDLTCPCINHEKPLAPPINRIDLFAKHLKVSLEDHDMDYHVRDEELIWAREYIEKNNLDRFKLIMVNPSSSTPNRDCPPDKLKRGLGGVLALRRDVRALMIIHESDKRKNEDWNFSEIHILKNMDVRQLAAMMKYCALLICPDSAMLHVAAALHHPTLTIFGPTDPWARVNYHPEAVALWAAKDLKNYPCWYEDPKDGWMCWRRLEESLITDTTLAMLNNQSLPSSRDIVTFGSYREEPQLYQVL
jgi:ADP-heptose:LPS heptosyltransferase